MLTDSEIDSLDTECLHHFAPNMKESVRIFARAVETAAYEKAADAVKALHAKISDPLIIGERADAGHNTLDAAEAAIRALAHAKRT